MTCWIKHETTPGERKRKKEKERERKEEKGGETRKEKRKKKCENKKKFVVSKRQHLEISDKSSHLRSLELLNGISRKKRRLEDWKK